MHPSALLSRLPRALVVLLAMLAIGGVWALVLGRDVLAPTALLGVGVCAGLAGWLAHTAHGYAAPRTGVSMQRGRLLQVVDALPWALLLTERGSILHANPAAHRFVGAAPGTLVGARVLDFVEPADAARTQAWLEATAHAPKIPSVNICLRRAEGEKLRVRLQGARVEYGDHPVLEILVSDRAEEHRAQAEVERLASFPQNNPEPIVEVQPDGTLRFLNDAARSLMPLLVEQESAHPFLHTLPGLRAVLHGGTRVATANAEAEGRLYEQAATLGPDGESIRIYGRDVTQREEVVHSLHQSEDRFARVFHLSPVAMSLSRLDDGVLLDVNESMARLLGYDSPADLVGRAASEVIWQDGVTGARVAELLRRYRRLKPHRAVIRTRTGAACHVIGSAELIEVGGVLCIAGMLIDVEEQERLRQRVEEERDFVRSILETAGMGLVVSDAAYRVRYVNRALLDMTGYDEADVLHIDPLTFVHLSDRQAIVDDRAERRESTGGRTYEGRVRCKDGAYLDVLVAIVPRIEGGVYMGTTSVVIDVTEQRQATREVERLRFFYENILHDLPIDVAVMDAMGRFLFLNERAVASLEVREQLVGKTILDYARLRGHPLELYERRQAWIEEVVRMRREGELEEIIKRPGGDHVTLRVARPVLDASGEVAYLVSYGLDVTDSKRSEAELIRARDHAEELSQLKSSFIANMSHEVRTPLTAVIGFAEVLQEEIEVPELREVAMLIRESGTRLLETLNSVLELARMQAGVVALQLYPAALGPLLRSSVELYRPTAERKGVSLHFEAPTEAIAAHVDVPAFNRILNNLLSNAIKFTDTGDIRVTLDVVGAGVEVRVADTGVGIDEAYLEKVFEEFQQESSGLSRSHQGTGLGLAIARRLAEMMHGTLSLESRKGEGSTFTLTLPGAAEA